MNIEDNTPQIQLSSESSLSQLIVHEIYQNSSVEHSDNKAIPFIYTIQPNLFENIWNIFCSEIDLGGTDLTSVHPKLLSTVVAQLEQV